MLLIPIFGIDQCIMLLILLIFLVIDTSVLDGVVSNDFSFQYARGVCVGLGY